MKNFIKIAMGALLATSSLLFAAPSQAAEHHLQVEVNGTGVDFPDAQPYTNDAGRTMVPVRFISTSLGYQVSWDEAKQKVMIEHDGKKIELTVGDHQAIVSGNPVNMDSPVTMSEGRAFVPLRFISEVFGLNVTWRPWNWTVYIGSAPADQAINVLATAYGNESGPYDYFGHSLHIGTVAVDPTVIPLGKHLYIEGYDSDGLPSGGMFAVASDIGGKIKGDRIDIYIPKNAMDFGRQHVKVHILD
jgi:3D (Asp-Asp-Asp) domain-containing protein